MMWFYNPPPVHIFSLAQECCITNWVFTDVWGESTCAFPCAHFCGCFQAHSTALPDSQASLGSCPPKVDTGANGTLCSALKPALMLGIFDSSLIWRFTRIQLWWGWFICIVPSVLFLALQRIALLALRNICMGLAEVLPSKGLTKSALSLLLQCCLLHMLLGPSLGPICIYIDNKAFKETLGRLVFCFCFHCLHYVFCQHLRQCKRTPPPFLPLRFPLGCGTGK